MVEASHQHPEQIKNQLHEGDVEPGFGNNRKPTDKITLQA